MARRSESCPRLARKDPTSLAQPLASQPLAPSTARSCTLQDLGPEDRQKVAKLLKQVVDLGQEVQQLKQQRDELAQQAKDAAQREQEMREGNQQLHKEHHSLKKKFGQVLLVLRASQAKIIALEAAQQAAPRRADCSVEVQTELTSSGELGPQVPAASSAPAGDTARGATLPAAPSAGKSAGDPEPAGAAESVAALRASLSATPGGPPLLHVARGAHVNITINHALEPAAAAATPGNPPETTAPTAASLLCSLDDSCDGVAALTLAPRAGNASEYGSSAPAAVIAIPTTTTAAAMGTAGAVAPTLSSGSAVGVSTEVALPELSGDSSSSFSTTTASSAWAGRAGTANWSMQVQQQRPQVAHPAAAREARDDGLGPSAMPRAAPRTAAAAAVPQPTGRPTGPRNILVDATMRRFEAVPIHEVRFDSHDALTASPMIVPPSDEVVAAASSLMGWQAQHSSFTAAANAVDAAACSGRHGAASAGEQHQRSGRKVLSFDPAIGQNGAFYFMDVADVGLAPERAGAVFTGAAAAAPLSGQANRLGPDGEAGGRHPGVAGMAAAVAERFAGPVGPQPAAQPFTQGGEATLRPWADPPGAGISGGPVGVPAQHQYQQHPHPQSHPHPHQFRHCQQQPHLCPAVPERGAPASPCSSYATESTSAMTPLPHGTPPPAPHQACVDTPASSSVSLSRMAVALDEVARQQRWDVQPPGGMMMQPPPQQQQHRVAPGGPPPQVRRSGGFPPQLGGGAAPVRQNGGPSHVDGGTLATGFPYGHRSHLGPHGGQGPSVQLLRHASAGSSMSGSMRPAVGLGPFEGGPDAVPHDDSLSACGSTSTWLGGNDVADRYDDSLVDILSQADEELEQHQHHQQHHQQQHRQRFRQQQQVQRPPPQAQAPPFAAPMPARPRAASTAASPSSEGAALRAKMQAASAEALLAANLYEENDVFSVILEQEGHV